MPAGSFQRRARPRPGKEDKRSALPRAWASEGVASAARPRRRSPSGSASRGASPARSPAAGTMPAERRHDAPSGRPSGGSGAGGGPGPGRSGGAGGGDPRGPSRHRPARSGRVSVCRGQEARRTGQGRPEARSPRRSSPSGLTAWASTSWSSSSVRVAGVGRSTWRQHRRRGPRHWKQGRSRRRSPARRPDGRQEAGRPSHGRPGRHDAGPGGAGRDARGLFVIELALVTLRYRLDHTWQSISKLDHGCPLRQYSSHLPSGRSWPSVARADAGLD